MPRVWPEAASSLLLSIVVSGCAGATAPLFAELERAGPLAPPPLDEGGEPGVDLGAADQLDRAPFVRAVLARNPSLAASRAAWRAALARHPQATALPDPMLEVGIAPLSFGTGRTIGVMAELRQTLPWPGKLSLASEAALAEAEAARDDHQAARRRLALMASLLFDDYYAIARSLELNESHQELLEEIRSSAESQFLTARASQQEPLQAELELAHIAHQRMVLESARLVVAAQMNELLHRRPELPLPPPPRRMAPAVEPPADSATLQEEALRNRQELRAAQARLRAGEAAAALAARGFIPDLGLLTSYSTMEMERDHRWVVGLALELPLLSIPARLGVIDEAEALLEASRAELAAAMAEVRSQVEQARQRVLEALHVLGLYDSGFLPTARAQIEAARAGYETGRNSFLALIDAERSLRTLELQYQDALAALAQRQAELTRALGRLPGLSEEETP